MSTIPECSAMNVSPLHLLPGVTWISSYAPSSLTIFSLLTQTVQLTYTCWNVHAWTHFLPNVPNLSTPLNHTVLFSPTPHTIPPAPTLVAPQPHIMPHMINLHNKVKVKSLPFVSIVEFT